GIWLNQNKVLVTEEWIYGKQYRKFPGGGLEFGEGTKACLKREWMEELGTEIEVGAHFYTTDFFQPSFFDNSQVISIYYFVTPKSDSVEPEMLIKDASLRWLDLSAIDETTFPLPIDAHVGQML